MLGRLFNKSWNPKDKHCYVTGGSSGLGLAVAKLLVLKGAHVSIVSRDAQRLENAMKELEAVRISPSQAFKSYSYDLVTMSGAREALDAVCEPHEGRNPDAIFMLAGSCHPRFFIEETEETMKKQMDQTYWVQAWTALEASQRMVRDKSKGKIVFHSAYIGYITLIGYAAYGPGRMALRALADTLRQEFLLYDIDIHIAFPGTMYTPGYDIENATKPKITLKIEETDPGVTGDQYAKGLLRGVQNGDFHISPNLLGNIFRASMRGVAPSNNIFVDFFWSCIGWVGLPIWRMTVDSTVKGHRKEHEEYLSNKGFYSSKTKLSTSL
ncbi:oxidoreductase [Lentinula aciculospora]|uniref:Oxidoreductase n=1 Tax=Lentinula aciculospora TaxID=153920 RepID=A0A9W9AWE6_9AGAR|nr:oxidoreductase [Lentinula aciculospora]